MIVTNGLRIPARLVFAASLTVLNCAQAPPDNPDLKSNQVWAREQDYLRFGWGNSVEQYLALFDQRFRGWSCGMAVPGGKAEMKARLSASDRPAGKSSAVLEREGETTVNRVITVFYRADVTGPDGKKATYDIVHNWARDSDNWKIVSGMCRSDATK